MLRLLRCEVLAERLRPPEANRFDGEDYGRRANVQSRRRRHRDPPGRLV
ncbi:hypothetical protein [Sphingomonas sp.]